MNQEQESGERYISPEINRLKTLFSEYKKTYHIENALELKEEWTSKFDTLIKEITELIPPNIESIAHKYCKENYPEIIDMVKNFIHRLKKKDNHICIEGETGSGKSTLTLLIFLLLCHKLQIKLNLKRHVLYMPKEQELSRRLERLKEYEPLWVDETIMSLNKMKYMNQNVISSNEIVQTERFRHNTVVYCVPAFTELTKSFRDVNIKFRIWCVNTERAIVRMKEIDPDIRELFGAWHTNYRAKYKINRKLNLTSTMDARLKIEEKLPGFAGSMTWPDMENIKEFAAIHLLYEVMKKRSRLIVGSELVPKDERSVTQIQTKQKETIKGIMGKHKNKGMSFVDWYEDNKDFLVMSRRTYQRYWYENEDKDSSKTSI